MEQPACNGRCLGWLSVSLIDHYVGDKPSMALAVENKVANFFIKTINSATQKVDKVRTCSKAKVAKHKQFLESFIFRISVGFSSLLFFLFFCYIRDHKYLKCIYLQSTSPLFLWIFLWMAD